MSAGSDIACDIVVLDMPIGWVYLFAADGNWAGAVTLVLLFEVMLALVVVRRLVAKS